MIVALKGDLSSEEIAFAVRCLYWLCNEPEYTLQHVDDGTKAEVCCVEMFSLCHVQ